MTFPPIPLQDTSLGQEVRTSLLGKAMLPFSLGALQELAVRLCVMQGRPVACVDDPLLVVAAGDHGIVAQGVTTSDPAITWQQCRNFAGGGGACGLFAHRAGVALQVVDVGVAHQFLPSDGVVDRKVAWGTSDFLIQPAMTMDGCTQALQLGIEYADAVHASCLLAGEMGIGNTASATALCCALTGWQPVDVAPRGSGMDDERFGHKRRVIEQALAVHGTSDDVLHMCCCYGGYEILFLSGLMIGCASRRIPILLDGFITSVAALVAQRLAPGCASYMIASHRSAAPAHGRLLEYLGLPLPLLDLGMWLGEGTGALLAWPLVANAAALVGEMNTFESAGVVDSTTQAGYR